MTFAAFNIIASARLLLCNDLLGIFMEDIIDIKQAKLSPFGHSQASQPASQEGEVKIRELTVQSQQTSLFHSTLRQIDDILIPKVWSEVLIQYRSPSLTPRLLFMRRRIAIKTLQSYPRFCPFTIEAH